MNDLGISFLWLAMQVTVFCGVVLLIHFVARQRNAGLASPTFVGLVLIIGLTGTLFVPMPRWSWDASSPERAFAEATTNGAMSEESTGDTNAMPVTAPSQVMESPLSAAFTGFMSTLGRKLASTSDPRTEGGLRWTGWFAIGVLAMAALGLLRLLAGWFSVKRCLKRAESIHDPALNETLDVLRAEMECCQPVAILESKELASAATVGWRRSVVIAVTVIAVTVIAVTVIAAIFVAGLRRPDSGAAIAKTPAAAAPAAQAVGFNLADVPKSVVVLAGIRPSKVAANDGMQSLVKLMKESTGAETTGIRIADIDQFLVIGSRQQNAERPQIAEPVMELRMARMTEFGAFLKHHIGVHAATNQSVDGFSVVASDVPVTEHSKCVYRVDDRTVLLGRWHALQEVLRSRRDANGGPDWRERLQAVDNGDAVFAFDVTFLRGEMEQQFRKAPNPMLGMLAPLWQNTNQVVAGAGIGDGMKLSIYGWGDDEGAAEKIQTTLQTLIPMANGMLMGAKASAENAEGPEKKAMTEAVAIAEEVVKSVKVTRDGKQVTIKATGDGMSAAVMTALLLPAVQASREAARRTQGQNNVKQILLALHNYHAATGSLPPAVLLGPDGKTKYSWRVALLPYMDQHQLYEAYDRNEPWDGPNNRKLLEPIPGTLRSPNEPQGSINTSYFALIGEHTAFGDTPGKGRKFRDFTDGMSNTLMVFETKHDTPWTKPEDIPYSADDPLPKFGGLHNGGFQGGFADGSVRFISENVDLTLLRHLITCDGGEVVDF